MGKKWTQRTIADYIKSEPEEKLKKQKKKPNALTVMVPGFLAVILIGGFLLMLPICNADGQWLNLVDAMFTSCTCVCVTGLVTVVPAYQFTLLGKIILLMLIQIGGWGIIVCAMWILILLKRRLSITSRLMIHDYFNTDGMNGVVRMLRYVVFASLTVEGVGALGFSFYFIPHYGALKGIWYSIFHAISAFCNAGVDLLGDNSLAAFVTNPWMNFVAIMLIVLGGLGFAVWQDLTQFIWRIVKKEKSWRRAARSLTLQTKLVLTMTGVLLIGGCLFFYFAEYNNELTFGTLHGPEKWMAAFFQSVTTRTAGFYTVSQAGLRNVSKFFSCILMFIGGSPASTAGGIKTVTIAVMLSTCWSILKGHEDTECFKRKIAANIVRMAIAVITVGFLLVLTGTLLIAAIEPDLALIDVLYEVISSVATVGLTADVTPTLCTASKWIVIVLMYIGRIGPITLPMLMATMIGKKNDKRTLAEEHIIVG